MYMCICNSADDVNRLSTYGESCVPLIKKNAHNTMLYHIVPLFIPLNRNKNNNDQIQK